MPSLCCIFAVDFDLSNLSRNIISSSYTSAEKRPFLGLFFSLPKKQYTVCYSLIMRLKISHQMLRNNEYEYVQLIYFKNPKDALLKVGSIRIWNIKLFSDRYFLSTNSRRKREKGGEMLKAILKIILIFLFSYLKFSSKQRYTNIPVSAITFHHFSESIFCLFINIRFTNAYDV